MSQKVCHFCNSCNKSNTNLETLQYANYEAQYMLLNYLQLVYQAI